MHKYEECEDCYFNDREPAICDECDDGDQFEPESPDEDAYDTLKEYLKPRFKVIPICKARFSEREVEEALREKEKEAA